MNEVACLDFIFITQKKKKKRENRTGRNEGDEEDGKYRM